MEDDHEDIQIRGFLQNTITSRQFPIFNFQIIILEDC